MKSMFDEQSQSDSETDAMDTLFTDDEDEAKKNQEATLSLFEDELQTDPQTDKEEDVTLDQKRKMIMIHENGQVTESILSVLKDQATVCDTDPDEWTALLDDDTMLTLAVTASQLRVSENKLESIDRFSRSDSTRINHSELSLIENAQKARRAFAEAAERSKAEAQRILIASVDMTTESDTNI